MTTRCFAPCTSRASAVLVCPPPPRRNALVVLARLVADELDLGPAHLLRQTCKGGRRGVDGRPDLRREVLRRLGVGVQLAVDLLDLFVIHANVLLHQAQTVVKLFDRDAQFAAPEGLEVGLHRLDGHAQQQRVTVAEVVLVVVVEVLGRHVAPAGDGDLAVHHQRLVVHALVDAAEVREHVLQALLQRHADGGLRVVDADVDQRMPRQRQQRLVRRVDQQVIDDHAHSHAPIGRTQQRLRGQDADVVGAPDEVLHLDRLPRVLDQPGPRQQRFRAGVEHIDAGLAGMGGDLGVDERGGRVVGGRCRTSPAGKQGQDRGDGTASGGSRHALHCDRHADTQGRRESARNRATLMPSSRSFHHGDPATDDHLHADR